MAEKYSITKKEEVYNLLKNKRNFQYMSEPLLRKLIDVMKVVRFREETILIRQGEENAFFYIIIKGSVSVYVDGKFLYKLRRTGDVFGEISFVTQSLSTATVKAEKDLGIMAISYSFFNKLNSIEFCLWLARVIGEKLIRTSKIKSEIAAEGLNLQIANEAQQALQNAADKAQNVSDTATVQPPAQDRSNNDSQQSQNDTDLPEMTLENMGNEISHTEPESASPDDSETAEMQDKPHQPSTTDPAMALEESDEDPTNESAESR